MAADDSTDNVKTMASHTNMVEDDESAEGKIVTSGAVTSTTRSGKASKPKDRLIGILGAR